MNIVTGGAGLIGSDLVVALSERRVTDIRNGARRNGPPSSTPLPLRCMAWVRCSRNPASMSGA